MRYVTMKEDRSVWVVRDMWEVRDVGVFSNEQEARARARELNQREGFLTRNRA